jgi:hypothetical protein
MKIDHDLQPVAVGGLGGLIIFACAAAILGVCTPIEQAIVARMTAAPAGKDNNSNAVSRSGGSTPLPDATGQNSGTGSGGRPSQGWGGWGSQERPARPSEAMVGHWKAVFSDGSGSADYFVARGGKGLIITQLIKGKIKDMEYIVESEDLNTGELVMRRWWRAHEVSKDKKPHANDRRDRWVFEQDRTTLTEHYLFFGDPKTQTWKFVDTKTAP